MKKLSVVIPVYNESESLQKLFARTFPALDKLNRPYEIIFVNDGSKDTTWDILTSLCEEDKKYAAISLAHNRGHQNALIAGLMEAKKYADITISMDCDGQDDINAITEMVDEYAKGSEIVFGVRNDRSTDSWFKRTTAQSYYKFLRGMGVDIIPDHADYRLMSSRVLSALEGYGEVNLFLRGIIPQLGFKQSVVYYSRAEREAGTTHYPLSKMMSLAIDGVTSFSIRPLRLITILGIIVALLSFIGIIYVLISVISGYYVDGWASTTCILCFVSGIQMISLGVIGEYIGKIYLETKHRPRYIVSERKNLPEE